MLHQGSEEIGWKSRSTCSVTNGNYDAEKDFLLYKDKPDFYFKLLENQFAIFFPEDVHAPLIGDGIIKKLVLKVKI